MPSICGFFDENGEFHSKKGVFNTPLRETQYYAPCFGHSNNALVADMISTVRM
jgi:hypothetical protein